MKNIFLSIAFLFSLGCLSQTRDCSMAHTGTFEISSADFGTTVIIRTKNFQREINKKGGYEATYDVVWKDGCHYELKNRKIVAGTSQHQSADTDIIMVEIVSIKNVVVTLKVSSNFSDSVATFEMTKIK